MTGEMEAGTGEILINTDSVVVAVPPDRFFKTTRDTAMESLPRTHVHPGEVRSLFTGHHLKPGRFDPGPPPGYQPDWILALILIGFLLQTWAAFVYRKRFRQVVAAPFSRRFLNQLARDGNLFNERLALALVIVYLITVSLVLFQARDLLPGWEIPFHLSPFNFFLAMTGVIVLFWAIKVGGMLFAGMVFRTDSTTSMYLLNVLVTNITTGLFLLPVLILVVYLKSLLLLYFAFGILLLSLLFLFIRGFMIGLTLTKFSYIFLFVYLCTLEILPLIIMMKLSLMFYGSMISVN